jgi:ribonuclease G
VRRALLISASPGELWAALTEDETLRELRVSRTGPRTGRVGEVMLGRVVALKPELPAALVDIGLDRPGFLSAEDAAPGAGIAFLREGEAITVQVTKEARADKAAGLSTRLRLSGRFLDFTPGRAGVAAAKGVPAAERERLLAAVRQIAAHGDGLVLRARASGAAPADLAGDAESLRARWLAIEAARARLRAPAPLEPPPTPLATLLAEFAPAAPDIVIDDRAAFAAARGWLARHQPELVDRLTLHRETTPLFEHYGIGGDIAAALASRVPLEDGGAITVELTAAATMIDVDSGSRMRGGAQRAILATNLMAAREAARQIRLRNLAGPIVIDFVGMRERGGRDRVRDALAAALADDGDAEVLGWTRLGHLELVRKRRSAPLTELLFERTPGGGLAKTPMTVALEALRALAREAESAPVLAPCLRVHPDVAAALMGDAAAARQELETRLGRPIEIIAEPGRPRAGFDIGAR